MGSRILRSDVAVAVAVLALLPAAAAGPGAGEASAPAPLSKGWGWLLASGLVAGVDPGGRTLTLAIAGQGRLETFEGQAKWRRQPAAGNQVVHLVAASVLSDAGGEPATIAAIRIGAPAMVWGAVRPDALVFGLKVVLALQPARPSPAASQAVPSALWGAVLHSSGGALELLTRQGTRRGVILTGATVVRDATGSAVPPSRIAPYDVLRVQGTVNSDGSIAATRIDVEVRAASAAQVSGAVEQVLGEVEGLVVGGVMVPVAPGCYYIRGTGPGAFGQLAPGQPVTVYGAAIAAGGLPIGVVARVVVSH